MVRILTHLAGSNDVELLNIPSSHKAAVANNCPFSLPFRPYKGANAASLSRRFVDFILLDEGNSSQKESGHLPLPANWSVARFANWASTAGFGADELFWATLNHADWLRAPGEQ